MELLERGQHLFGKDELDLETSAEFLIILLDFIEKWSTISSEFSTYYKQLIDAGIQFPSSLKHLEKTPNPKKQVKFCLEQSDSQKSSSPLSGLN